MEETDENGNPVNNNSDDRIEVGVHQSLMMAVENAFNHLLGTSFYPHFTNEVHTHPLVDIEDIDLILSSSNGSVNVMHLLQKRDELSMDLFKYIFFFTITVEI